MGKAIIEIYRALRGTREDRYGCLPLNLLGVHAVFHVSMLRKYTLDPTHVVNWGELVVDANVTLEEGLVRIMDSREQVLRRP